MTTALADSTLEQTQALACLEVWGGNEPVDTALRVPGMEVWIYAVPYENAAAGGDVHFISNCGSGRIARFMIADVSGHGNAVAEIGRTLRGLIRRYMNHISQTHLFMSINRHFAEISEANKFATAVMMTYFSPDCELSICNAGHPHPMVYRQATRTWEYLNETAAQILANPGDNTPLGVLPDANYAQFQTTLQKGDLVLTYTDSLIESVCRDGSLLGAERLLQVTRELSTTEPSHLIHHLLAKLSVMGATLNDDVTLLLARCTGPEKGANFWEQVRATGRFIGLIPTAWRTLPWPELTVRNIVGSVIPSFSHRPLKPR